MLTLHDNMIVTAILMTPKALEINMTGHADYAEHGKDIVCAAVSSITEAVVNRMLRLYPEDATIKTDDGELHFRIELPYALKDYDNILELLTLFVNHINDIATAYPDNVAKVIKNYQFE